MNFATGYAFNTTELFTNFPTKKLSISGKVCQAIAGCVKKKEFAVKVFLYAVKIILLDIIENNVTFKLPTQRPCQLRIVRTEGEDFIRARKNGKWQDVDFLASDFSGYQMQFSYIANEREIKKPVYLSKGLKDKITENTNKGMQYY